VKQLACALLLLCLVPGHARAGPLEDAHRHYQRLEYDQALASLEEARQSALSPKSVADSWLLEGEIQVVLSREEEARVAFIRALRLQPSLGLPAGSSPKLKTAFDAAVALEAARRQRQARVSLKLITPSPPLVAARAVTVYALVDHAFAGMSLRLQARDADHETSVTLPMIGSAGRYRADVPAETVRPSGHLAVRVELLDQGELVASAPPEDQPAATAAAILVSSPFAGAELSVGHHVVGALPMTTRIPVEPGEVIVQVRGRGVAIEQKLDVRPGEIASVTLAGGGGASARSIARTTLLSVGAALLVTGGVLAYEASAAARDLEGSTATEPGSGLPTTQYSSVQSIDRTGRAEAAASIATLVIGGASVVAGLLLFVPRWKRPRAAVSR
jgi:hypothetical protein